MNREKNGGFIQYIVIIAVILSVVFLSQQPFARPFGKSVYSWSQKEASNYWSKTTHWLGATIYPKVTQEVEKRGEPLKEEVITQKDNAVKNIWENIKNYFAEQFSKISGTEVK